MTIDNIADALRTHPFVEGLRTEHIEKLAALASPARFEKSAYIYREGDQSSFFYLVLSGAVGLEVATAGRQMRVQTVGKGEALGWSSLLDSTAKFFQARVQEPVVALGFDGARLRRACEEDPVFGYELMRRTLKVVASRLQATRLQLLDMYAPAAKSGA